MKSLALVCVSSLLGISTSVSLAQAPPAAPATPPAPPAAPAPVVAPTRDQAIKALEAAAAAAKLINVNVSCAVLDSQGKLVALARMDGARAFTTDVAQGKALMSTMFGQPSGAMAQMANSPAFAGLNATTQNRLFPIQGALPIVRNGQVQGAIGCSGANSQQDEDAARAGIAAIQ